MIDVEQTGGPAFPQKHDDTPGIQYFGMTLRDYFAAMAMQGLLASETQDTPHSFASSAYRMADAMLEARK